MAILFGLGFFCLSLLFSLFERRSNIIVALTSFGILMIIFCFSYHNADYIVYEDLYHALKTTTNYSLEALDIFPLVGYLRTDYGYVFITKVFYDLGFSYFDYRCFFCSNIFDIKEDCGFSDIRITTVFHLSCIRRCGTD